MFDNHNVVTFEDNPGKMILGGAFEGILDILWANMRRNVREEAKKKVRNTTFSNEF
jgi:hypothetical protein